MTKGTQEGAFAISAFLKATETHSRPACVHNVRFLALCFKGNCDEVALIIHSVGSLGSQSKTFSKTKTNSS